MRLLHISVPHYTASEPSFAGGGQLRSCLVAGEAARLRGMMKSKAPQSCENKPVIYMDVNNSPTGEVCASSKRHNFVFENLHKRMGQFPGLIANQILGSYRPLSFQ